MSEGPQPRDAGNWARPSGPLAASNVPSGALDTVGGKQVLSPIQGFGQMWQKTYKVSLGSTQVTPQQVIAVWKDEFPLFWPDGNEFYAPLTGIAPGEVALLEAAVGGGLKLSTGVLVIYADDESFTFMTPQGHMFAGWITFSAFEEDGATSAQAEVLMRAQDPLTELGLTFGGHRKEDRFWADTHAGARPALRRRRRAGGERRLRRAQTAVVAGRQRPPLERVPLEPAHRDRAVSQAR